VLLGLVALALSLSCGAPHVESIHASAQAVVTPTCVTVQRGAAAPFGTVADDEVRADQPTTNLAGNGAATAGILSGVHRQVLISWDVSAIPSTATVTSATATFVNNLAGGASTVSAYLPGAWTETGATWSNVGAPIGGSAVASGANAGTSGSSFTLDLTATVAGWVATPTSNTGIALDAGSGKANVLTSESPSNKPKLQVCYLTQCQDSTKNGVETDIDCGGGTCAPCASGKSCLTGTDCTTGICSGGVCAASLCSNGVKDGTETDVDCGGACSPCADGLACLVAADCSHSICGASVCRPLGGASVAITTSCSLPSALTMTPVDVQYGTVATQQVVVSGVLTTLPAQWLSLYVPPGTPPAGGWPTWLDIHGGGGTADGGGRNSSALSFHCRTLAAQGVLCATMDYRLATASTNGFPAAVNDGRCVARWLRDNLATYGGNPARIGGAGYSFGFAILGKVASEGGSATTLQGASIAYDDATCSGAEFSPSDKGIFKVAANYYGNSDFTTPSQWSAANPNAWWYLGVTGQSDPLFAARALAASVHPAWGDPPLYVTDGSSDTTVAPAMVSGFYAAALAAGVNSTLYVIPGGIHGFAPFYFGQTTENCTGDAFILSL
jgi:acetyl esterase/lipase